MSAFDFAVTTYQLDEALAIDFATVLTLIY